MYWSVRPTADHLQRTNTTHVWLSTGHKQNDRSHESQVKLCLKVMSQVTSHKSQVRSHKLQKVTSHESQVTSHKSQVTSHESQVTSHKLWVTSHKIQVTNHESQKISCKSQVTWLPLFSLGVHVCLLNKGFKNYVAICIDSPEQLIAVFAQFPGKFIHD